MQPVYLLEAKHMQLFIRQQNILENKRRQYNIQDVYANNITSDATRVSVTTVNKSSLLGVNYNFLIQREKYSEGKTVAFENITECYNAKILSFFTVRKEAPSIGKLLAGLKENEVLNYKKIFKAEN